MAEPCDLTLAEARDRMRRGELTPVDLVRSVLARIEQVEQHLHAWARTSPDRAMADAERLAAVLRQGRADGPLHGIPVGVKDIYYTAGLETSAGSPILAGFVPSFDAAVVQRLRQAGAVLIGKTATTEFGYLDPGPTTNPWNTAHTPGGSSSGSAAAVAAGMCLGAVGTQTVGSIIRPAAYCGVVGLKPTYGRVSRHGIVPLASTLDHPGPLAGSVRDAAILLEVMAGPDPQDPTTASHPVPAYSQALVDRPPRRTIGVPDRYFTDGIDPAVAAAYADALKALEGLGMQLRDVRLPQEFEAGVEAGRVIMQVEGAAVHRDWFRSRPRDYGPKLRALIETGILIPEASYVRAKQARAAAMEAMRLLFEAVDVLATPATPTPAPEGLASTGDPVFNAPFSTFGLPALGLPMGFAPSGLPLGLQLAGRPFDEVTILQVGAAYEAEASWGTRRPPLPGRAD